MGNEPPAVNADHLAEFAREVADFVERSIGDIPQPDAQQPVINVAPSTASIEVNVPQQAAPIVNIETAAPQITVEAAAPIVNVAPASPAITIENRPPEVTIPPPAVAVSVDMTPVAQAISDQTLATQSHADATQMTLGDLVKATNANGVAIKAMASAIADLVKVMAAPKTIVTDNAGKPVGLKIGK